MKLNLANATRVFLGWAALATLPLAAPLHGASPGFPFAEDFQSQLLLNSTDTTARWTSSGVTLGRARGVHETVFTMQDRPVGAVGTDSIHDIALQDLNGDGRLDIVTAGQDGIVVYFNDPVSGFSPASSTVVTDTFFHSLTFGDYDRDGDLDIVSGSWLRRSNVMLHKNDGRGGFDGAAVDTSTSALLVNGLATADIDGDGHLDLVVALNGRNGGVDFYRNDGNAVFSQQRSIDSEGPIRDIQIGDLNGDGRPDIVLGKDRVSGFHLHDFDSASSAVWRFEVMTPFSSRTGTRIALGDVNNDSHLDIVAGVKSGRNRAHLNDGSGGFGSAFISLNRTTADVELGDMDGDGDLDVVEGNIRERRGFSFIYANNGNGSFNTAGSNISSARTRAVALGDVDNDGDLDIVFGHQNVTLIVKENPGITAAAAPSDNLFDTGHGRVVSGKVNGDARVPHIVFLTATAVQQAHTEIEYYLSNDGGGHWVRGYPGESVRFLEAGNDLRWRAELKSHSSTLTPTLMRVGIENVLQVSIDGDVFRGNEIYTATSQTTREAATPVTIRLLNRGDRVLTITGIETVREAFMLQDRAGNPLPQSLSMEIEGKSHEDIRLVFKPERRGTTDSVLTILGREGGRVLPEVKVGLRGRGLAPEINIPEPSLIPAIEVRVGTSDSQTVEIKNNGEESLSIRTPTITNPQYSLANPAAFPVTATVGGFVRIGFWFEPGKPGTATTDIIFPSNADNGTQTTVLEGKGLAPVIAVERLGTGERINRIDFGRVREGGRTTRGLVIRNTGDWDMDITGVTGTDEFFDLVSPTTASINGIGMTVEKESSETVVFSFTPARNMRSSPTANIVFTSDAFNDTQTEVMLRGIGTAPEIDLEPSQADVNFGNVRVGQSGTRTVVIENMGDEPLIVSGVVSKETRRVSDEFLWVPPTEGAASQTVAAGTTAMLTLSFRPTGMRSFDDTLMIDSDAVNMVEKPLSVEGEGIAPVMVIVVTSTTVDKANASTPSSAPLYDFGDVTINTKALRRVLISNELGTAPLRVGIPVIDPDKPFKWEKRPVSDTVDVVAGESTASLILAFRPTERGPSSTTLVFSGDALNGPQTVTLKGRGTGAEMELRVGDKTLAEGTTHTFSATKVNTSRTVAVQVHNRGNVPMNISTPTLAKVGNLAGFSLVESGGLPDTVPEGSSASFTFRFQPTMPGTATALATFTSDAVNAVNATRTTIALQGRGTAPMISVTPTGMVRFDDVRAKTSTDRHVTITNTGDAVLEVTSASVVNGGVAESLFSVVSPAQFPHPVGVGEDLRLTVRFSPLEPMDSNVGGILEIKSDASNPLEKHPQVSGQGVVSMMSIVITGTNANTDNVPADSGSVPLHDFGDVPINTSASRKVLISNRLGNAELRVEIPPLGGAGPFRWQNDPVPEVVVVEAGKSTSGLVLVFEPEEVGPQVTTLTFVSNAFENATQVVTLKGRGRGQPRLEVEIAGSVREHEGEPYRFGQQAVGTTESVAVTISNKGNDNLVIAFIGTTANTLAPLVRHDLYHTGGVYGIARLHPPVSERYRPGYSISDGNSRTILAGSSTVVMLRFSPSLPSREDNALLVLKSNDPEHSDWTLELKGSGTGPLLSVPFHLHDSGYRRITGTTTFFYDMGEAIAYDKRRMPVEQPRVPYSQAIPDTKFSRPLPRDRQHRYWLIHNWGNENLEITYLDMEESGTGFRIYEHGWQRWTRSLVPNQYRGGGINFLPTRRGVHTGTFVIRTNDVTLPELRVQIKAKGIAPGIDVQADGFGNVSVGGSSTARVVVRNDGDAPLTISGVAVDDGSQFSAHVVFSDFPVVLTDKDSRFVFDVSFAPAELGISTAALTVLSDALRESTHTVVLQGNGREPETEFGVQVGGQVMGVQPTFNFRRVRAGMTTAVTVAVENKGSSVLNVAPLLSGDDGYSLANSGTRVIAPNSSGSWVLRFHPENSGPYNGMLDIVNANNHSVSFRRLSLAGVGVKSGIQVEIDGAVYRPETEGYKFGKIGYGTSRTAEVTITNTGDAALSIKSIGVTPDQLEYSIHYKWIHAGISTRYRKVDTGYSLAGNDIRMIPAGSSASFTLHFTPVIPVVNNGVLKIASDNPEHPEWNLSLTGRGTGPFLEVSDYWTEKPFSSNSLHIMHDDHIGVSSELPGFLYMNVGDSVLTRTAAPYLTGEGFSRYWHFPSTLQPYGAFVSQYWNQWTPTRRGIHTGVYTLHTNDGINPVFTVRIQYNIVGQGIDVAVNGKAVVSGGEYHFGDVPVGGSSQTQVRVDNDGNGPVALDISSIVVNGGNGQFDKKADLSLSSYPVVIPHEADPWPFDVSFAPTMAGPVSARLIIRNNAYSEKTYTITLRGNGVAAPSAWADGAQRPAIPTFTALESDISAPRFVGLGYADEQSRLWLAFDEPAQILSGADARVLADGAALSGFKVLANYTGDGVVEDIGVLRARYRSGGVVMDLARGIVPADASLWARYTPPSDGVSGIYDLADPPNRISSVRLFMLPRSAVLDYDGDGFPDALEARLGGNPLVADDVVGLPEVALLRTGAAGSPAAVAYSGIRADGVAAHLGVVTTGASSLAAYYLSDTFGYSGGYAENVGGYGCTEQFPADYASPVSEGGCAVVDFNSIRAGVEHRIGWLATNAVGYWAVAEDTASRLPEMVILRVPEFNMKRRNVFVANSAAADATVVVGAFHDGPASSQSLTVSLSNVAAADNPSSSEPDGFSVSVVGVTTDTTSYAITGVHSGEAGKLWLAGDPLSSLTPDKYSLGKVTQTSVVRLADDNLPPLFGRASLYVGTTADENERHAVVVHGTESYIALLPVVQGSAQTASAFEVLPWDGAGGGPVAADDRMVAVNEASPAAGGALVRIAFTASNPLAAVRNTVSLEVAASSAGASTATTVLTWPVIDSADALATITGDDDNDGIPDVRDSYRLLNRLPVSVAGGVSGYPERSSAGADGWHHIRPLLPLHSQHIGSYAMRAGLSFSTGFAEGGLILGWVYITTPEQRPPLADDYQPGIPVQMNYADFAASMSRDEFDAMAQQSRQDIAVVYNFRLHGVEPSVAQGATLAGGRAGVVIPLPESLHETTNILPLHYTNGAWSGFNTGSDAPATAGFAPLQAGACPDDSGVAGSPYRTENGALNTRKRTGDACMVLYLTDGAAADRDGNINGVVDALIGLAATAPPR